MSGDGTGENGGVTNTAPMPPCPACASEYTYESGALYACPMCAHEWAAGDSGDSDADSGRVVKDAVGNVLADGDSVTLVKSVKVSGGGGGAIKVGTKVRGITLITDGVGDHDIDANVPGFGRLQLKSSVVKKSS